MKKILYRTLIIILLAAVLAAVGRLFNRNESHDKSNATMTNTNTYHMLVDSTDHLILYDITDCQLDLACEQMPDTAEKNIVLCLAAAFTGECLDYFDHSNILGPHISRGVLFNGYTENKDGIPFESRYALFVWRGMDEQGNILKKDIYPLPNNHLLSQVVEQGGMAFTQHWVIKDKQIFTPTIQPFDRCEYFRSLCIKNNRVCIIDNREIMSYRQYLDCLLAHEVEHAIYMDMGDGWNHSFYHDSQGILHVLHPKTHTYPTNWLVVYK